MEKAREFHKNIYFCFIDYAKALDCVDHNKLWDGNLFQRPPDLPLKKTYNIIYETSRQSRFDARYWMLGADALGQPRGMVWGGRKKKSSRWGTHVCLWWIHFNIWQNQYNIVKFKNKIKFKKIIGKKKKKKPICR